MMEWPHGNGSLEKILTMRSPKDAASMTECVPTQLRLQPAATAVHVSVKLYHSDINKRPRRRARRDVT